MTRPCECGLASRPRRLFGLPLEPVDGAPGFFSGSIAPGGGGLPSNDSLSGFLSTGNGKIQGGWSIFHTWWTGSSTANPAVSAPLRGQGSTGWFGWYENSKIEDLTTRWLQAPTDAERLQLTNEIQAEAFETVPSIPLGQFFIRSAYRSDLTGVLVGTGTYSWNVQRGLRRPGPSPRAPGW